MSIPSKLPALLLLIPLISFGSDKEVISVGNDSCEKDQLEMTTIERTFCSKLLIDTYKKDIVRLNEEIEEKLKSDFNEPIASRFKETNNTWITLQDQMCNLKSMTSVEDQELTGAICRLEYHENRYNELRFYIDTINGG